MGFSCNSMIDYGFLSRSYELLKDQLALVKSDSVKVKEDKNYLLLISYSRQIIRIFGLEKEFNLNIRFDGRTHEGFIRIDINKLLESIEVLLELSRSYLEYDKKKD